MGKHKGKYNGNVGDVIMQYLDNKGMTIEDLSNITLIPQGHLMAWFEGSRILYVWVYRYICMSLGVDLNLFIFPDKVKKAK